MREKLEIGTTSIIQLSYKILEKLLNPSTPPEVFVVQADTSKAALDKLRKPALSPINNSATRLAKLEYMTHWVLLLFCHYITLKNKKNDADVSEQIELWLSQSDALERYMLHLNKTFSTEHLLCYKTLTFLMAMKSHVLILGNKHPRVILTTVFQFACTLQEYRSYAEYIQTVTGFEPSLFSREVKHIFYNPKLVSHPENAWSKIITETAEVAIGHVVVHEEFPKDDVQYLIYAADCLAEEKPINPTLPEHIRTFNFPAFQQQTLSETVSYLLSPEKQNHETLLKHSPLFAQIKFLHLQLQSIAMISEIGLRWVCADLTRQSMLFLFVYLYFTKSFESNFLGADATLSPDIQEQGRLKRFLQRTCAAHTPTALETLIETVNDYSHSNSTSADVRRFQHFLIYVLMDHAEDKTLFFSALKKMALPKRNQVGNPLSIATAKALNALFSDEKHAAQTVKNYLLLAQKSFNPKNVDEFFPFLLICKKSLERNDAELTVVIREALEDFNAVVLGKPRREKKPERAVQDIFKQNFQDKKKKPKKKNKKNPAPKTKKTPTPKKTFTPITVSDETVETPKPLFIRRLKPKVQTATVVIPETTHAVHLKVGSISTDDISAISAEIENMPSPTPTPILDVAICWTATLPIPQRAIHFQGDDVALGIYLHGYRKPDDFSVKVCQEVITLMTLMNETATLQNDLQGALFLYGGALLSESPNDWDLKYYGTSLEDMRGMLESHRQRLGIADIHLAGARHPHLRVKFFSRSTQVIEISLLLYQPDVSLAEAIKQTQSTLDFIPNTMVYTRAGSQEFLIDPFGAHDTLKQSPFPLRRVPCEHTEENKTLVYLRGIKFLSTYACTPNDVESWFRNEKACLLSRLTLEPFVKLLMSGRSANVISWLMYFDALNQFCEPLARLDTTWLINFDQCHSAGYRAAASLSTQQYWEILTDILALFLSPFQKEVVLEELPLLKNHAATSYRIKSRWQESPYAFFPCYTPSETHTGEKNGIGKQDRRISFSPYGTK